MGKKADYSEVSMTTLHDYAPTILPPALLV